MTPRRHLLALGIDTSTSSASVGLRDGAGLWAELSLTTGLTHSETLLPAVGAVLRASGRDQGHLSVIAVAAGPGSFTGLRIGMATAKGLALACEIPLVGFSTLETMALAAASSWGGPGRVHVCTLIDAGRGEVYRGLYSVEAETAAALVPEAAVAPQGAGDGLPDGCLIAGDGIEACRELTHALPRGARVMRATPPIGALLARRALDLAAARGLSDLPPLVPNYLRPSDAERAIRNRG